MDKSLFPKLFKGIALFTPGGDLIYGIDPTKQGHWHLHLCACLQELLRLPEPPHFLVPGYTATIDRWLDHRTQELRQSAEMYQPVGHHQALLNSVFGTGNLVWQVSPWQEGSCDPIVLETYRHQFPQLWEDHDLIVRFERTERLSYPYSYSLANPEGFTHMERYPKGSSQEQGHEAGVNKEAAAALNSSQDQATQSEVQGNAIAYSEQPPLQLPDQPQPKHTESYILRLFVSGHSAATEHTLKSLHQLLETSLPYPYTLKVIDVFKHPDQAEANQISATPTLLRVLPQPVRRIVGDLTNIERVLQILGAPED